MYKIFVMAFFVLALAGCRSRFETLETASASDSVAVAYDECSTTTASGAVDSVALATTTCDRVEFAGDSGQIILHPDGMLELRGVAGISHRGRMSAVRKTAASASSDSVTVRAESKSGSVSQVEKTSSGESEPENGGVSFMMILAAAIVIFITIGIWRKLKD